MTKKLAAATSAVAAAERVRALGAGPIALDQQPAGVRRRIAGGS
jgi:hypothetical protein